MNLEIALALLAASAPTTAVILRFAPQRARKASNGAEFLTTREFDTFRLDMMSKFSELRRDIADVRSAIGNS